MRTDDVACSAKQMCYLCQELTYPTRSEEFEIDVVRITTTGQSHKPHQRFRRL